MLTADESTLESLKKLVIIVNNILEEDYNRFFKDKETYHIYLHEGENSLLSRHIFGKELKNVINENTELQEELNKYKESKLEEKEEK